MKSTIYMIKKGLDLIAKRPKGWLSLLYNTVMSKLGIASPLMLPVHISIEPTNVCNLRCPVCETGNRSMERRAGMLDFETYKTFIDQIAPHASVLMFYFMGEPFLNKRAYDMIRYARDKGLYVETCTNGDFVDPDGVIYSDINEISFQIGGMTQETHEKYRVRGDLAKVEENIRRVVEARNNAPQSNVQIEVGFVVMKHNEHEVPEFLRWAKKIGIDKANVIDPCVRTVAEGEELLPKDRNYWFYDEGAFRNGVLKPKHVMNNECTWIWNAIMVMWNGDVVPCCRDPHGRHVMGNVFETPLNKIWNARAMKDFRKKILTNQKDIDICELCSGFGVPKLHYARGSEFEVQHRSVVASEYSLPSSVLEVVEEQAQKEIADQDRFPGKG